MVWAGLVGLVVAIGCAIAATYARQRIRRLTSTETLTVRELEQLHEAAAGAAGPGQFRYRCEVVGDAGPAGPAPLTSQLGQHPCVWHKHKITHKYWETSRDSNGNSRRQERTKVVSEFTSAEQFLVRDATGAVPVTGHKGIDGADKVLDRFERDSGRNSRTLSIGSLSLSLPANSGSIGYQHEEWTVAPGRRLFVHGEATDAQGSLMIGPPADGGLYLVSTRSQEQLLTSANARLKGFGIGAAVVGLAGLVLLIAGAIAG
jgi:hypothetical protein